MALAGEGAGLAWWLRWSWDWQRDSVGAVGSRREMGMDDASGVGASLARVWHAGCVRAKAADVAAVEQSMADGVRRWTQG
ncbi:hypothetical protein GUJ93_ZPchr0005g14448 [Zizania palustris]|uniref:Uncharacterized protein n=1 Tax=Zizania palustris TaxID=103762 RepID=A0A8J5SQM0_ZIZPA|nr:hypothetical protein GUJ93_ZPchr0005g14448 [Zizania palustris]